MNSAGQVTTGQPIPAGSSQQGGAVFRDGQWWVPAGQGNSQPTVFGSPPPFAGWVPVPSGPVAVPYIGPTTDVSITAPEGMETTDFLQLMTDERTAATNARDADRTAATNAQESAQNTNLWGGGINAATDIFRQGFQFGAVQLHYKYLETAAGYQKKILEAEIDLKEDAIGSAERMQDKQVKHEENLARINAGMQRQLALISANTKEKIAEMITINQTFSRRTRDCGVPFSAY